MTQSLTNLTPHAITLYSSTGIHEIAPSGQLARIRTTSEPVGEIGGLPVVRPTFGEPDGLPPPTAGTVFIVSAIVLTALKDRGTVRTDVVAPATGPNDGAVRDASGRVAGITRFITL